MMTGFTKRRPSDSYGTWKRSHCFVQEKRTKRMEQCDKPHLRPLPKRQLNTVRGRLILYQGEYKES